MKRLLLFGMLVAFAVVAHTAEAQDKKKIDELKKGLQALNDFVGVWNGDGKAGPTKPKITWAEQLEWGWKFKGDDVWMVLKIKDGKVFKGGDLKYIPSKKNFELVMTDASDQKRTYEGAIEKDYLTLVSVDAGTKETHRLKINVAGDGVRLNMAVDKAKSGSKLFAQEYVVGYGMEGAGLGSKGKEIECIVSGGRGTGTVSYKGQTYYICCSGCRDAFNENPEFYVKQWEAKKGKK
jgi:YHS domain